MTVRFELGVRRIDQYGGHESNYSIESDTSTIGKQHCVGAAAPHHTFTVYSLISYSMLVSI